MPSFAPRSRARCWPRRGRRPRRALRRRVVAGIPGAPGRRTRPRVPAGPPPHRDDRSPDRERAGAAGSRHRGLQPGHVAPLRGHVRARHRAARAAERTDLGRRARQAPAVLLGPTPEEQAVADAQARYRRLATGHAGRVVHLGETLRTRLAALQLARAELVALLAHTHGATALSWSGGGTPTAGEWARAFLAQIGAPGCGENRVLVVAWEAQESTEARFNPLATTHAMPGATDFNSVGVKNYRSVAQGLAAARETLEEGADSYGYRPILASLRACNDAEATAWYVNASAWCRGCTDGAYLTACCPPCAPTTPPTPPPERPGVRTSPEGAERDHGSGPRGLTQSGSRPEYPRRPVPASRHRRDRHRQRPPPSPIRHAPRGPGTPPPDRRARGARSQGGGDGVREGVHPPDRRRGARRDRRRGALRPGEGRVRARRRPRVGAAGRPRVQPDLADRRLPDGRHGRGDQHRRLPVPVRLRRARSSNARDLATGGRSIR